MSAVETLPLDSIAVREGFNARGMYREIEPLADSIEALGLEQPLVVYRVPDDSTPYLQSGFRRRLALQLVEQRRGQALRVPCIAKAYPSHEAAMLAALAVDETADPLRRYDVAKRVVELRTVFSAKEVQQTTGISLTTISSYETLFRELDPEVIKFWSKCPGPETEPTFVQLHQWAKLPRALQRRALATFADRGAVKNDDDPPSHNGRRLDGKRPTMNVIRRETKTLKQLAENKKLDAVSRAEYKGALHALRFVLGEVSKVLP